MIDHYLLPHVKSALTPIAKHAHQKGMDADRLTLLGFGIGVIALPLIALGHSGLALFFILANRIADGLDGLVAREIGPTDRGAFLDITLDFFYYSLIPLAFAVSDAQNALPAAFVITSFVGTGTSFLTFSLIAERRGLTSIRYPNKGIYYLGGLTEGFETILFFVLICIFPNAFSYLAYIFGTACFLTAALRSYYGYQTFEDKNQC